MTFTQLEIFVLVAELGGFTAAGDKLGISQSAVSHALKQLETEWGVTLLSRDKTGIDVTSVGKSLLVRVRELLAVSEAIHQEVSAVRGLNRGVLRIGSFGLSSSLLFLPRILDQYRYSHPEIEIFVDEGPNDAVTQWIAERRVDVGFVVLPDERFDTQPLVEDQLVAVVPASHPLARQKSVNLSDLCHSSFIMTAAGSTAEIEKLFASAGLRPNVKHRYSQIITVIKMVESGAGVSIASGLALSDQVMAMCPGAVKKPLSPAAKRSIGLAVPSLKHASPAVHAFLKTSKLVLARLRHERARD
jgi:DNA-binding transcriptional LysR family regulator